MLEYSTIKETLEKLRQGRIIPVTDNEDHENEDDFTCATEFAITEDVSFMTARDKGLICMPISKVLHQKLQFPQMVSDNRDNHETAFTVSVNHTSTITGISTAEHSITTMKCVEESAKPENLRRLGHMFPLTVEKNGVLERNERTEAAVGLMRLAGLKKCGLCCRIMREDRTMMRTPELIELVKKWGLKMITIKALQEYHRRNDRLVEQVACTSLPTKYSDFRTCECINELNDEHHVALVKREIGDNRNLLCRVHSECLTGNAFGSERCDCGQQFAAAMTQVEKEDHGILLYTRQEGREIGLINKLRAYALQGRGVGTLEADLALGSSGDLWEYFIGTQILRDLGTKTLRLLTNNPDKVYQFSGFGMEIVQRVSVQMDATAHDLFYPKTKQEKMDHLLNF